MAEGKKPARQGKSRRNERLADALRTNLHRRKLQARGRLSSTGQNADAEDGESLGRRALKRQD